MQLTINFKLRWVAGK